MNKCFILVFVVVSFFVSACRKDSWSEAISSTLDNGWTISIEHGDTDTAGPFLPCRLNLFMPSKTMSPYAVLYGYCIPLLSGNDYYFFSPGYRVTVLSDYDDRYTFTMEVENASYGLPWPEEDGFYQSLLDYEL